VGRGVTELIARLAGELGERVTVRVEAVDGGEGEIITLLPRNPVAASAAVEHDPDGDDEEDELWLTIADDGGEPTDLEWLETALRAVFAGRVRAVEGSGRYRLELELSDGDVRTGTSYHFIRGLLPAPGWQGRATVTQYEPY
jgi:hypothetical protein